MIRTNSVSNGSFAYHYQPKLKKNVNFQGKKLEILGEHLTNGSVANISKETAEALKNNAIIIVQWKEEGYGIIWFFW